MDPPNRKGEDVVGMKTLPGESNPSTSDSCELELGSGHHHQPVKLLRLGSLSGVPAKTGNLEGKKKEETVLELEKQIKRLYVSDYLSGYDLANDMKVEYVSKLEQARVETADRDRAARRIKWKEEVRMELLKREEFKRQMASTPLKKVTELKAKADMSKMSTQARKKFKGGRTSFLFHEVFPILYEDTRVDVRTLVVVGCRPVSKAWKSSTEACILPTFERNYNPQGQIKSGVLGSQDIRVCSPEFHSVTMPGFNIWGRLYSGNNPFFAKRLSIIGGDADWKDNLQFWKAGEVLLRRWGQEIWVLHIRFDKEMSFDLMYEQLVKYLKLMPNLRSILIENNQALGREGVVNEVFKYLGHDIYAKLRARIERNPLPELPHLKSVWFEDHVMPPLAQAMFAKYSGTLEVGIMHDSANGAGVDLMELLSGRKLTLPQLHELNVSSYASSPGFVDLRRSCPSLETFQWSQCSLKGPEDFLTFFENLNRLRHIPTLKRLWLTIQPADWTQILELSEGQMKGQFLELPQLEMFRLCAVQVNLKNIDFLLPCVSLKDLDLNYQMAEDTMPKPKDKKKGRRGKDPLPEDEIIQFSQYKERLYESNFWRLFPELKFAIISVATCTLMSEEGGGLHMIIDKMTTNEYCKDGYNKYLGDTEGSCSNNPTN